MFVAFVIDSDDLYLMILLFISDDLLNSFDVSSSINLILSSVLLLCLLGGIYSCLRPVVLLIELKPFLKTVLELPLYSKRFRIADVKGADFKCVPEYEFTSYMCCARLLWSCKSFVYNERPFWWNVYVFLGTNTFKFKFKLNESYFCLTESKMLKKDWM